MASGLILNPIHLLHIAPLATSTGSLAHALVELTTTSAFLSPSIRKQSETLLPNWFDQFFRRSVWSVLTLNLGTISTTAATLVLNRRNPALQTTSFYWAGLAGAVGHLLFVPLVAGPVQRIVEDCSKGKASVDLERWVSVHRIRMLLVDFPAWLAFVGAVLTL
ncbi:hypothetical protein NUU61_003720 [Penicillium alfredii]|uniref:Uncharacterized protein n=1 Tax=Penicillium alfredii TaxID=1506179 RepID=A0A9W9FJQ2_9EURO|nr:uncharacterized protein NUU61_003720 [Penicillium alfredii]KAJ5101498.1 hypothetical protein NUU61_003720 [Penicillium alfredii]